MKICTLSSNSLLIIYCLLIPAWCSSSSVPLASLWSGFWRRLFGARTTEEPGRNLDHINSEASQENSGGVLTPQHNVDHLLAQAVDLYGNGDYIKSVEVLMSVLEQNSSHLEANRLVGNTLLVLRKPDLAESYLFKAVQLSNWTDASLVSNLAESLRLNGDIDLALRVLERGYLSINQTDPTGRIPFEFGVLYERTGNYSDAADWYLVSALTQSVNADAWLRASTLLFPPTSWNLKFAENVLSRAVQMNPSNVALIFDLGVVLQSSGRPDEAIILYYEVLRLDPDHDGAVANLASALHSMNRKEEAIILYDKILLTALSLVTESRAFPQIGGVAIALGNFATLLLEEDMSVRKAVKVAYYASQIDRSSANLKRIYTNALQRLDESTLATRSEFISLVMSGKWIEASAFLISNDYYRDEAWFNFATGMVEFFRENYEASLLHCSKAKNIIGSEYPFQSLPHLILGCISISNQYLGNTAQAIDNFNAALASESLQRSDDTAVAPLPFLGFSMSHSDIMFSMIITMKNAGLYDQCLMSGLDYMNLAGQPKHGATMLLVFSFVDWKASVAAVNELGADAMSRGLLSLCENCTLSSEVLRIQRLHGNLLTDIYDCLVKVANNEPFDWKTGLDSSLSSLMGVVAQSGTSDDAKSESGDSFVLLTQYFVSNNGVRDSALINVLSKNLQDQRISEIALINDVEYDFSALNGSSKIKQYISGRRLTFQDAFRVANSYYAGRNVIVANSDIVFDESVYRIGGCNLSNTVLALTKWSLTLDRSISLNLRLDSQDAWIFKAPIKLSVVEKSDFPMGAPKCDNRLARLFYEASYRVLNPALTARAIEVDPRGGARGDSAAYGSGVAAVKGSTALVLLSDPGDMCI